MSFYRLITDFLKNCSQITRFLLTFLLLALVICAWYLLFYSPLSAAVAFYTAQNQVLNPKKVRLARILKTVEKLPEQVELLEKELANLSNGLNRDEHSVLEKILSTFEKSSISLESCKAGKREECGPFWSMLYECSIEGAYEAIVGALKAIEALYPAVACMRCELRKTEQGCEGLLTLRLLTSLAPATTASTHEGRL